jgi:hypothetical protein
MESDKPFVNDRLVKMSKCASRHISFKANEWYVGQYHNNDIQFKEGRTLNDQIEKVILEQIEDEINGKHTTPIPVKQVYSDNVILNQGLQESIDRDIGSVSTALDYASIGTDNTAEAVTQTDLLAELTDAAYGRKQYSTAGTRTRNAQTAVWAILWDETSLDSPPETITEAGIHWHVSDAAKCHSRVVFSDFTLDTGDTLVIRTTELQQNGSL